MRALMAERKEIGSRQSQKTCGVLFYMCIYNIYVYIVNMVNCYICIIYVVEMHGLAFIYERVGDAESGCDAGSTRL